MATTLPAFCDPCRSGPLGRFQESADDSLFLLWTRPGVDQGCTDPRCRLGGRPGRAEAGMPAPHRAAPDSRIKHSAAWAVLTNFWGRPTVSPSVQLMNACGCHFWIKGGVIEWCPGGRCASGEAAVTTPVRTHITARAVPRSRLEIH